MVEWVGLGFIKSFSSGWMCIPEQRILKLGDLGAKLVQQFWTSSSHTFEHKNHLGNLSRKM